MGRSVCTLPPKRVISDTNASAMRPLPPSTTGQPTPCPSAANNNANELVSGAVKGSMEWAAVPANSALAASVLKRDAIRRTDGVPTTAKRASAIGSWGIERIGPRT